MTEETHYVEIHLDPPRGIEDHDLVTIEASSKSKAAIDWLIKKVSDDVVCVYVTPEVIK